MDQELLVDSRIDDGVKLLSELVKHGFDVTVACWVRTSDSGSPSLYIGSTAVERGKIGDAYVIAYDCLSRVPDASIELSDLQLVPSSHPIAKAALAVRERYPERVATRYHGKRLGGLAIEEAYIYPRLINTVPPVEVLRTVLEMIGSSGPVKPSAIKLRDGTALRASPTGIRRLPSGEVEITLRDPDTNTERVVALADLVSLHEAR
jgi:hypothetical protein